MLNIRINDDVFPVAKTELQFTALGLFGLVTFEKTVFETQLPVISKYLNKADDEKVIYDMLVRDGENVLQTIQIYGLAEVTYRHYIGPDNVVQYVVVGNLNLVNTGV